MVLNFIAPYRIHEPCLGAGLHGGTVEGQLCRYPKIANELSEGISHVITIDLHHRISNLEPTLVRIYLTTDVTTEGLELPVRRVSGKFPGESFNSEHTICSVTSTDGQDR